MTNNGDKTEPGVDILGLVKVLSGWVDVPDWAHKSEFHAYYWHGRWAMRVHAEGLARMLKRLENQIDFKIGQIAVTSTDCTDGVPGRDDDQAPVGVPV